MINDILQDAEARMRKSIENLAENFGKIRTGRAHPSLLDTIHVEYYGAEVPVSQVANITVEDARTLVVQPWEQQMVPVIEKAIMTSDLGVTPMTAGNVMRIPLPPLTEERRRELTRVARQEAEQARVAIRNIRRDANGDIKALLKEKEISEDEARRAEEKVQKLTDQYVAQVDDMLKEKEADLLSF